MAANVHSCLCFAGPPAPSTSRPSPAGLRHPTGPEMARSDEHTAAFLAFGVAFVLLGLLTPSITPRYQALCWETSTVGFVAAAVTVWRHPVVWSPLVRCWYNRLMRQRKAKPARGC